MKFCSICNGRLFLNRGVAGVTVELATGSAWHNLSYELECDTCGNERNIVMPRSPLFVNDDERRTCIAMNDRLIRAANEQLADLLSSVERDCGIHPNFISGRISYAKKYEVVERWLDEKVTRVNKSLMHDSFDVYRIKRRVAFADVLDGVMWNGKILRWNIVDELSPGFVNRSYARLLSLSIDDSDKAFSEEVLWDDSNDDDEYSEDLEAEHHGYFDDMTY
jgi:hypothetical protein